MIGALLINFRFLEQKFAMKSCKLTFNCSFLHMVSLVDSDVVKVGVVQCNSQLEIWREGKSGRYGDMLIIFSYPHFHFCNVKMGLGKQCGIHVCKRELTCLSKQGNVEISSAAAHQGHVEVEPKVKPRRSHPDAINVSQKHT
jgi:hypothetical protein